MNITLEQTGTAAAYLDFAAVAETILAIVKEHGMHVSFCAQWGVDLAELGSLIFKNRVEFRRGR